MPTAWLFCVLEERDNEFLWGDVTEFSMSYYFH